MNEEMKGTKRKKVTEDRVTKHNLYVNSCVTLIEKMKATEDPKEALRLRLKIALLSKKDQYRVSSEPIRITGLGPNYGVLTENGKKVVELTNKH